MYRLYAAVCARVHTQLNSLLNVINFLLFYKQAISITQAGQPEDKLELAFRLYDIDRNGTIEESEMAEVIKVSV